MEEQASKHKSVDSCKIVRREVRTFGLTCISLPICEAFRGSQTQNLHLGWLVTCQVSPVTNGKKKQKIEKTYIFPSFLLTQA